MRDDFGCVNFAGGEVGHLITFSKSSLEKGTTLLTCFVFGLGKSQGGKKKIFKRKEKTMECLRYLSQNFSTAVALPRGRISDYPGHF